MEFGTIVLILLGISEALALIPGIASNSLFQLAVSILKRLAGATAKIFRRKPTKPPQ